jgi:hypothetical protein
MAFTIPLAWFCAARGLVGGATCHIAGFTTIAGWRGDMENARLESTITSLGTRSELTPLAIAVNWAFIIIASTLIFVSIAMRTVNATFHSIEK